MGTFLAASIIFGTLAVAVNGQQSTCYATDIPAFSMAAIRQANQAIANQYFVIGGMFDIHKNGSTAYDCSADISQLGFINMLAFFWGLDRFSSQSSLVKSLSVGAVAFDNCMRPDQTIQNMYDYAQCRINIQGMLRDNLVAYVGPYMNEDAVRSGSLAADLGITVFSPMADSQNINFNDQKTLLRLKPSFTYDLLAIREFLKSVNITYVIILYAGNDISWRNAYNELTSLIASSNVRTCIQYTADVDSIKQSDIVSNLVSRNWVRYVIPLVSRERLVSLFSDLVQTTSTFFLILTPRIGRDLDLMARAQASIIGSIIIDSLDPVNDNNLNDFNNFLAGLPNNSVPVPGLSDGVGNEWIKAYFLQNSQQPLPNLNSNSVASPLKFSVYRTLLSTSAIIQGMNSVIGICGNLQFCDQYRNQFSKNSNLYQQLKAAFPVFMDNSGDLKYSATHFVYYIFSSDGSRFIKIGEMNVNNDGTLATNITNLRDPVNYGATYSQAVCPSTAIGQCCDIITTTAAPVTTASMMTSSSPTSQTTVSPYSKVNYPTGQAITGAYTNDIRKDSDYGTRFDYGQKWIIALGVLAGLGILCVAVFEIYILYKLLGTPTGSKWRTMWLGQLLLFGIFLCYLVLFAYLPTPTKATCGITRFGVGVSYAFCFAVLLVKLMVILTSKPNDVLLPGDIETPNYLKGTYQFLMFIFAVCVQVVIDVQWLITVPPEAVNVTLTNGEHVWICNHYTWQAGSDLRIMSAFVRTNFENHLMSLIYVMVMILITTILSLKAHGIITNHRESVFVGIASGFSIPIWLAWGLVGGLNKNHAYAEEFGDACIAFGLLITATLILFAMFLPKVRHLVNMGIEGIYLEDDRETIYGGSVILAPSSYKSKGSGSVIYVNNQGIYSEPVVISNGDPGQYNHPFATHLKHPGSVYSVPGTTYLKNPESVYGGSTRVLRVTDDLKGRHPQKRSQSEVAYGTSRKSRSHKGTLPRSKSQTNLGAL